jgi:tRNA (cytidine/uridine-2'-O-)-methyltransferase
MADKPYSFGAGRASPSAIQRPDRRVAPDLPTVKMDHIFQSPVHKLQKMEAKLKIALYQPDIAGNVGTILRLAACLGVPCSIIEPCGFPFSDKALKRAGMDYAAAADICRMRDWVAFLSSARRDGRRIALLTIKGSTSLFETKFAADDILLFGSESAGVPQQVHAECDLCIRIPMQPGFRSLNVAVSAGIALSEALRQTGQLPVETDQ